MLLAVQPASIADLLVGTPTGTRGPPRRRSDPTPAPSRLHLAASDNPQRPPKYDWVMRLPRAVAATPALYATGIPTCLPGAELSPAVSEQMGASAQ